MSTTLHSLTNRQAKHRLVIPCCIALVALGQLLASIIQSTGGQNSHHHNMHQDYGCNNHFKYQQTRKTLGATKQL